MRSGRRSRPCTASDISSRAAEGPLLTANALAVRLASLVRRRHVPLLVLRVAELERIAWREGRVSARRLERRAREAFARIVSERMRAADLPAHDRNSECFSIALTATARRGEGTALPDDCRAALARATSAFRALLPVPLETGWTLVTSVASSSPGLESIVQTALQRGTHERQRFDFFFDGRARDAHAADGDSRLPRDVARRVG